MPSNMHWSASLRQVGVDVPEASVMLVEHAERFGLAQLHQLRGRVGRGARASTCFLVASEDAQLGRLAIMQRSQNGFVIAEHDLKCRRAPQPRIPISNNGALTNYVEDGRQQHWGCASRAA